MKFRRFASISSFSLLLGSLCSVSLTGCGEEEIRVYKTPKPQESEKTEKKTEGIDPELVELPNATTRLMGAVVLDQGDQRFYFKVMGPIDIITKNEAAIEQFLASVKFTKDPNEPLTYKVPEGWKPGKGNQFSLAAFVLAGEGAPELTVSRIGGSLIENINRWLGQVGLKAIRQNQLSQISKEMDMDGRKARHIDLKGIAGQTGMAPMKKGN